ncbi:MAG: hypothetical protein RL329_3920, partial [Bacteroidota bacterium]
MRFLNKIVFINSASIKYDEIMLDGNVHLTGTQGVGKSTVLRAILFFYNADPGKLGISIGKKSYAEYYFPFPESYIIYEVAKDEGYYCVVAYKSQNRVCFRFMDTPYEKDLFVQADGKVPNHWSGIAAQLNMKKVFYSNRQIDSYQDYKHILYGAEKGRSELKRFALLESDAFQNIPRTIQNVFLNSKLEAEFIKQTIIASLENDITISLHKYKLHLKEFHEVFEDINRFKDKGATKQMEGIQGAYTLIRHLEKEKIKLAKSLKAGMLLLQEQEPFLKGQLETGKSEENRLLLALQRLLDGFSEEQRLIREQITRFVKDLEESANRQKRYAHKNMPEIIKKVTQKADLELEALQLTDEKSVLTATFKDIEVKYKALSDELKNQLDAFINQKDAEKTRFKESLLELKQATTEGFDHLKAVAAQQFEQEQTTARTQYDDKLKKINDLRIKQKDIQYQIWFEAELKSLEIAWKEHQATLKSANDVIAKANVDIAKLEKDWEKEVIGFERLRTAEKKQWENQIPPLEEQIRKIVKDIDNSKDSFYDWLNNNCADWTQTIGKVVDTEVLYNTDLVPQMADNQMVKSFYGIDLNLDAIEKQVETVEDKRQKIADLEGNIKRYQEEIGFIVLQLGEDKDKLKKAYQRKMNIEKKTITEQEYELQQAVTKEKEAKSALETLKRRAIQEKKVAQDAIEAHIAQARMAEKAAAAVLERIKETVQQQLAEIDAEKNATLKSAEKAQNELFITIVQEVLAKRRENETALKALKLRQQAEQLDKGADTKRITEIDVRLIKIKEFLNFIEDNRDLVATYRKDKEDYFDKETTFEHGKTDAEARLAQTKAQYELQKKSLDAAFNIVKTENDKIDTELKEILEDKKTFDRFCKSDIYKDIESIFNTYEDVPTTDKKVRVLMDELKDTDGKLVRELGEMKKTIRTFLDKFSENNIFKFKKYLPDDATAFLNFAHELNEFVAENKIAQFEDRSNDRFSDIIKTIVLETGSLITKEGEVQTVIRKINHDFVDRNFAFVIKKIELRIVDSEDVIVVLLKAIKKFNDEQTSMNNEHNLFDNKDPQMAQKMKEAIGLVKQFNEEIKKRDRDLNLADFFKLEFKIIENDNETAWVEKLSNIGSEGTDVLVKAMLNIMLLNVFKEEASRKFKTFKLHCMMDEIGKLHPNNVRGILRFANDRNILLINGSPMAHDSLAYRHIYQLRKDEKSITKA